MVWTVLSDFLFVGPQSILKSDLVILGHILNFWIVKHFVLCSFFPAF